MAPQVTFGVVFGMLLSDGAEILLPFPFPSKKENRDMHIKDEHLQEIEGLSQSSWTRDPKYMKGSH